MTAPAPETVTQQRVSVTSCLAALAEALGVNPAFDWPCACGRTSDQCSKREDGTCDG